jgi:hypothetical protein
MTRVCEAVTVSVSQTGEPIGFRWRDQSYQVTSKPVRWFSRKEWWVESARAQRGIGAGVLEIEMWRFCASDNTVVLQFELIRNAITNQWQLNKVFDAA